MLSDPVEFPVWLTTRLPAPPFNILGPLLVVLGIHLIVVIDAVRDARSFHERRRPWYSRWFTLVPVWGFSAFLLSPAWAGLFRTFGVQAFRIPGGGMEPTLIIGDHLLVDRAAFGTRLPFLGLKPLGGREPRRGELVVFRFPEDRERPFIKRLIGLPGEVIEIRGRTVVVDGRPLREPYARFLTTDEERLDWGPTRVPSDHLFVLGDNRDNSRDSRFWGFVPAEDLLGLAKVVYFSRDEGTGRVRWDRIGLRVHR